MDMKTIILSFMLLIAAVQSLYAQQTVVQTKELDRFSAVTLDDKFKVRLRNSSTYSVRVIADERIAGFIVPVVKNGSLIMLLDKKKYSPELKKELKEKGAQEPVLEVEIFTPELKSLTLKGKATLLESDEILVDRFRLDVSGNAKVERLHVKCNSAELKFSNGSFSNINIAPASKVSVLVENSANVNICQNGGNGMYEVKGSAVVNVNAEILEMEVNAAGGSETYLSGIASVLTVDASGTAKIDAEALEVKEGKFLQCGSSKCHVNVEQHMTVNLTGGTVLTFKRKPNIEVERIINSTLIKADDPKRK